MQGAPKSGRDSQPEPRRHQPAVRLRLWRSLLPLPSLAVLLMASGWAHGGEQGLDATAASRPASAVRATHGGQSLAGRVDMLAKALELDASQKLALQGILQSQREQVRKIWSDTSMAPAYRIASTMAVSDRTGDAIRAILNEEQKQKYNLARPPQEQVAGFARPDVAEWMGSMQHD